MREELGVPGFLAKAGLCEVAECSVTAASPARWVALL